MRIFEARLVRALALLAALAFLVAQGCETSSTPSAPVDGSTAPSQDGAVCACQTPDCLPNCSDQPVNAQRVEIAAFELLKQLAFRFSIPAAGTAGLPAG